MCYFTPVSNSKTVQSQLINIGLWYNDTDERRNKYLEIFSVPLNFTSFNAYI